MFTWTQQSWIAMLSYCAAHFSMLSLPAGDNGEAMSQDTGTSADKTFAAAWARVHGNDASVAAAPSRLATAWQAQHDSPIAAEQLHSKPATRLPDGPQKIVQPQATAAEQHLKRTQQSVDAQPSMTVAQSPLPGKTGTLQQLSHMAEANILGEAIVPNGGQMYDADNRVEKEQPPASASPISAAAPQHPGISPAACVSPAQQRQGQPAVPASNSPMPCGKAGSPAANTNIIRPHAALADRTAATGTRLAGPAVAAASMQQAKADRDSSELEARAMHLAMQVTMLLCRLCACQTALIFHRCQ